MVRQADATDDIEARGYHRMDEAEVLLLGGKPYSAAACLDAAIDLLERKGNVVLAGKARAQLADIRVSRGSGPTQEQGTA